MPDWVTKFVADKRIMVEDDIKLQERSAFDGERWGILWVQYYRTLRFHYMPTDWPIWLLTHVTRLYNSYVQLSGPHAA